jgi:spermidine/putrescine transport system permease protein
VRQTRSESPQVAGERSWTRLFTGLFVGLVLVYLYAPVVVVVLFSFADSPTLSLPIDGLTTRWYEKAFSDPLLREALRTTLLLALVTAVCSGVLGVSFALGVARISSRWRNALLTMSLIPAVVPALVVGISLALLMHAVGISQGFLGAAIGQVVVATPFVILTMNARMQEFDFAVLEAARDCGASALRAFWDITLPLIRPAIIGACLLAMALSVDEFVVTWFNIGNGVSLPVHIWGLMRRGIDPSINALATTILAALVLLVVLSSLFQGRRSSGGRSRR